MLLSNKIFGGTKILAGVAILVCASSQADTNVNIKIDPQKGYPITQQLMGIFYEDLNYAADGGLYPELVQNRSFDYTSAEKEDWHPLTNWDIVKRGTRNVKLRFDMSDPIHFNNPSYAILSVGKGDGYVGLSNSGFDGIRLVKGQKYKFSIFARQLTDDQRALVVQLEDSEGKILAKGATEVVNQNWQKYQLDLIPESDSNDARLVILSDNPGYTALDMVSLFPQNTFKNRENGLRADLAQAIADINPKFIRFPGGCLVHGDGIDNMYNWKSTIGPLEQRKAQRNIWGYHQTLGLGYFEYFQFAEDVGAEPLPVLPAGVTCQNSGGSITRTHGEGQMCVKMSDMPAFIQNIFDLIEWANGPVTSKWGKLRAEAGHPEPFNLKYLGIGNEDQITEDFNERFTIIYNAVTSRYPNIKIIGTSGPWPDGEDYEKGWKLAKKLQVPFVDEHMYKAPDWFWSNLSRYDSYSRKNSKVYVGEWAAHIRYNGKEYPNANSIEAAISEAAYLTSLERNGDIVEFASYAPLLANAHHTQWTPNLITFDNSTVNLSANYAIQKLFGNNGIGTFYPLKLSKKLNKFTASSGLSTTGDKLIIKLVNGAESGVQSEIQVKGKTGTYSVSITQLSGTQPKSLEIKEEKLFKHSVDLSNFTQYVPPYSVVNLEIDL